MQQFPSESERNFSADRIAGLLLEGVPSIMRSIREQMRGHSSVELTVVQFRTLAFLNRQRGAALSSVAEHVGVTLPAASKIVNILVSRGLLSRKESSEDRRKNILIPTSKGERILESARKATRKYLAGLLGGLGESDRKKVAAGLEVLNPIFVSADPPRKGSLKSGRRRRKPG